MKKIIHPLLLAAIVLSISLMAEKKIILHLKNATTIEQLASNLDSVTIVQLYLAKLTSATISNIKSHSTDLSATITDKGNSAILEKGFVWSTSENPTLTANQGKSTVGGTTLTFSTNIYGLTELTTYYVRPYATNSTGTGYGEQASFKTLIDLIGPTVILGTQTWMVKNLAVTTYNDGKPIPNITDDTAWSKDTGGAYCDRNNTPANSDIYGRYYNWYAVNTGKLCPTGWHVPSQAEWTTLVNYLIAQGYNYDDTTTGNKLGKAMAATTSWESTTITGAVGNTDYPAKRNATGFSALAAGSRQEQGFFILPAYIGYYGYWWSATETGENNYAKLYSIHYNREGFLDSDSGNSKNNGFNVRCVKD